MQSSAASDGQRRGEEDPNLSHYDSASQAVASFLNGSYTQSSSPPTQLPATMTSTLSVGSASGFSQLGSGSDVNVASSPFHYPESFSSLESSSDLTFSNSPFGGANSLSISTAPTLSSVVDSGSHFAQETYTLGSSSADPFGYLDSPSNFPPASEPLFISPHYEQRFGPWTNTSALGNSFGQMIIPLMESIHPFCYVTFGAGMRQKEVDTYTANHKIEARYLMGSGDGIPYHVPL